MQPIDQPVSKTLFSLQAGRAIAALLVVFFHNAGSIFALDKYWGFDPSQHFFDFAHAGVEYFFVLSGFIILYIHWDDIGNPSQVIKYLRKRFTRIYPIYWMVLAVICPIYFINPSFGKGFERDINIILSSFALVHVQSDKTIMPVAWTLYHEIYFYVIFALAILNKYVGIVLFIAWMAACALCTGMPDASYPATFYAAPINLLFLFGMAVCVLTRFECVRFPLTLSCAGFVLFFATGMDENYHWYDISESIRILIYGFASAMMLAGVVTLEKTNRISIPAALKLIGDASYSIYLTHFTFLSLAAKVFIVAGAKTAIPAELSFILLPALSIAFGIGVHHCVEKPLLRKLSKI